MVRAFYENEVAKKQLNALGLFNQARQYMRIKGSKVYFDAKILSGHDENGKSTGFGSCTIKPVVIASLQGKIKW